MQDDPLLGNLQLNISSKRGESDIRHYKCITTHGKP